MGERGGGRDRKIETKTNNHFIYMLCLGVMVVFKEIAFSFKKKTKE